MKLNQGRFFVLFVFALAAAMAGGGLWYLHASSRRSMGFWTTPDAVLIRQAKQVEILRLRRYKAGDETNAPAKVKIADHEYLVIKSSAAMEGAKVLQRGFSHIRKGLLSDAVFDWKTVQPMDTNRNWEYGIRFVDEERALIVLLTHDGWIMSPATKQEVYMAPVVKVFQDVFSEAFGAAMTPRAEKESR